MLSLLKPSSAKSLLNTRGKLGKLTLALIVAATFFNANIAQGKLTLGQLSLDLSPQVQAAVDNGVMLTIDCEFANVNTLFMFKLASNEKNHRFSLSRHILSGRYIVKRDDLITPHMFRTISQATKFITTQAISLFEADSVYDSNRKMRLSLNKYELPAPMRLQAFIFNEWHLNTGWLAWEFES